MKVVRNDEAYLLKKKFALDAFKSNCLIYANEKWYTPREFMDSDFVLEEKQIGMQKYHNATRHSVKSAVLRKLEDLRKAQKDYEEFMQKVVKAFDLSPVEAKKNKA